MEEANSLEELERSLSALVEAEDAVADLQSKLAKESASGTILVACLATYKDLIGGSTGGKGFAGVLLDSKNGTFTMGGQSGAATFATGKFHKVRLASDLRLRLRLSDGCAGRCR